jgi:hypothetical protein
MSTKAQTVTGESNAFREIDEHDHTKGVANIHATLVAMRHLCDVLGCDFNDICASSEDQYMTDCAKEANEEGGTF